MGLRQRVPAELAARANFVPVTEGQTGFEQIEDRSVDAVLLINVAHHIPSFHSYLTEMSRIVRSGEQGTVILREPPQRVDEYEFLDEIEVFLQAGYACVYQDIPGRQATFQYYHS
jgi:ubiquinone/menaquinone biosynthesis C-methylase UbiE